MYFTTGGRGTQGGLYRVSWKGARAEPSPVEPPWVEAIKIDSPLASFSVRRAEELLAARIARRGTVPFPWKCAIADRSRSSQYRVRALELLCQVGPEPEEALLFDLASDHDERVRARAVGLLGQHVSNGTAQLW